MRQLSAFERAPHVVERNLIRERTLDGLRAAQGHRGGRPAAVNDDILTIARASRERGESVTAIARHLGIGCSTGPVSATPCFFSASLGLHPFTLDLSWIRA
jgi:DNA invertase Pin-like site-specific DNA recombinase